MLINSRFRYDSSSKVMTTEVYDPELANTIIEMLATMTPLYSKHNDWSYNDHISISEHYPLPDGSFIYFVMNTNNIEVVLISNNYVIGMFAILVIYY